MYWDINKGNEGGFDFSNYERNKQLNTNLKHKYKKTYSSINNYIFKLIIIIKQKIYKINVLGQKGRRGRFQFF